MLVKNPTGGQITYTFVVPSLVLGPGESAEIDNSYTENTEFQRNQEDGIISIIKYVKDYVSNKVEIWMGRPPTDPTVKQKGAMVAANNPSTRNPFVVAEDTSRNCVQLIRASATSIKLYGIESKEIWVANDRDFVDIPIICNTAIDQAIDNNGIPTGSTPPKGVILNAYTSGNNAIAGDKLLRLSTKVPEFSVDGMYLNTQRDWKFVGWVYIDPTDDIKNDGLVASYFNPMVNPYKYTSSGSITAAGPAEELISPDLPFVFMLPSGWKISVLGNLFIQVANPDYISIRSTLITSGVSPVAVKDITTGVLDYSFPIMSEERNLTASAVIVRPELWMKGLSEPPIINWDNSILHYSIHPGYQVV